MTIHHMVFVKFKRDARKEDIQRALAEIDRLPERNREIKNWVSGFSPEPRLHNGAFDHGLACDLADWDAMDRYMYHEAHISAGPLLKPLAEYWLSFDFVVDYAAPRRFPAWTTLAAVSPNSASTATKSRPPWGHRPTSLTTAPAATRTR